MKDITIHPQATIKEAMEALDKTAKKVLLVIDENRVLIGALTDGDIRRYILKRQNLIGTIENVYNKNPIFVSQKDFDPEKIKKIFTKNKIDLIPILDHNGKVLDYITWEKVFGNNRKTGDQTLNVPVVIMAGGSGTRLEPFTKVLPKPLIPVGEKPIIDHIIDKFRTYGVCEFYLTIHHKSKILRAYFEEKNPDYSISFAEEVEPRGTAGSLKLLSEKLDRPFFVSNCDIIIETDYDEFYRFHTKNSYDITLMASTKQFNIPYGICELNGRGNLERIQEKPEYIFLVNTGMYMLNPNVIDLIPDNKLFHITHLMDKVRENKGAIGVYPVSEKAWIDVGQWAEYRKALKVIEGMK
ncbi:MAG: sugar phosphate nucleotidyltransferase [Thermodesulfobacteriota bacterium]|nr:sugar phosphate nucleotidyltransferase [Thermodesulfobacteriota bacterium]